MNPRQERALAAAKAELAAAIDDTVAEWGDDPPLDDIGHDLAQSIAWMISDPAVRREFCRTEGVRDPVPVRPRTTHPGSYYGSRKPLNDRSQATASHGRQEWSNADDAAVLEWDHSEEALFDLAVRLGRSTEATRQRFNILHREPRDSVPGTRQPRQAARSSEGRPGPQVPTCGRCGLVHPGEC